MRKAQKLITTVMFALLLKLFGCSGPGNKGDTSSKGDSLNAQISKSIEDFKNQTIPKLLTAEIIDTISDENLLQAIFDNLVEKFPKDNRKRYQTVKSGTKPQQAIYIIWVLEAEVNNGGFNQYYFNTSGQYADLAPEALKLVGATQFADLVTRANAVYEKENERITKHQDGTLEGFSKSYEDNPLNKFDDQFYALSDQENLQNLQVDFVRKNKQFFFDKGRGYSQQQFCNRLAEGRKSAANLYSAAATLQDIQHGALGLNFIINNLNWLLHRLTKNGSPAHRKADRR